jgi:hypothetical protein
MSVDADLFAPIVVIMYRFCCNHGDDVITFSAAGKQAVCPHCFTPALLIGSTRHFDGHSVYTSIDDY